MLQYGSISSSASKGRQEQAIAGKEREAEDTTGRRAVSASGEGMEGVESLQLSVHMIFSQERTTAYSC